MIYRFVALNANNRRVGESHPRAKLLDREVDQVHALLDAGMSLAAVAEKMDVSKSCIQHIHAGRNRSQAIARTVRLQVA